jgi:hypothetical protein
MAHLLLETLQRYSTVAVQRICVVLDSGAEAQAHIALIVLRSQLLEVCIEPFRQREFAPCDRR